MTLRIYLWRGFLLVSALFLAWISLVNGLGNHYVDALQKGDEDALAAALEWLPDQPVALLAKAAGLASRNPAASVELLERAYRASPADPRPLTMLAGLSLEKDLHLEHGDAMAEYAARLAPADARNQRSLAAYWGERGQYDKMIDHWSTALEADPSMRTEIYPALLAIAGDPTSRSLLEPLAASPPSWWTHFFQHAARNAPDLDTVHFLYVLRRQSVGDPLTPEERAAYVARLKKEGAISDAYVAWLSGLDGDARRYLGLLFNGGFELPIEGRAFGWQIHPNKHFSATTEPMLGANGRAALRLSFRAFEGGFGGVSQSLFLDPGVYRLSGRVKVDRLVSQGGLRWMLRCLRPTREVLGEGPPFLGSSDWSLFDFTFEVPQGCDYQQLVLVSAGTRAFERKFDGDIWFDDMRISRATSLDAAARADAMLRNEAEPADSSP